MSWRPPSWRRRCSGRELTRGDFRRYISPRLADKILDEPRTGERRDCTSRRTGADLRGGAMFADLRGFTAFAERLSPGESCCC